MYCRSADRLIDAVYAPAVVDRIPPDPSLPLVPMALRLAAVGSDPRGRDVTSYPANRSIQFARASAACSATTIETACRSALRCAAAAVGSSSQSSRFDIVAFPSTRVGGCPASQRLLSDRLLPMYTRRPKAAQPDHPSNHPKRRTKGWCDGDGGPQGGSNITVLGRRFQFWGFGGWFRCGCGYMFRLFPYREETCTCYM